MSIVAFFLKEDPLARCFLGLLALSVMFFVSFAVQFAVQQALPLSLATNIVVLLLIDLAIVVLYVAKQRWYSLSKYGLIFILQVIFLLYYLEAAQTKEITKAALILGGLAVSYLITIQLVQPKTLLLLSFADALLILYINEMNASPPIDPLIFLPMSLLLTVSLWFYNQSQAYLITLRTVERREAASEVQLAVLSQELEALNDEINSVEIDNQKLRKEVKKLIHKLKKIQDGVEREASNRFVRIEGVAVNYPQPNKAQTSFTIETEEHRFHVSLRDDATYNGDALGIQPGVMVEVLGYLESEQFRRRQSNRQHAYISAFEIHKR